MTEDGQFEHLTARQQQVLAQIAAGKTNKEIALVLGFSFGRVKDVAPEILRTMNAISRTEAAVRFATWKERTCGRPSDGGRRAG